MQTLDVISVNLWQMAVSLLNLVLLFLIVKRFLYRPVKQVLAQRQSSVAQEYQRAEEARRQAIDHQRTYEEKLRRAGEEADEIIKTAAASAALRERELLAQAKAQADGILRQARADAVLERKRAEETVKWEIIEISALLAGRLLEREVSPADHRRLIDSVLEGIGESTDGDG